MNFLGVLILFLWVVSVAGYARLLFFAGKQSRKWGLAVLFLSPMAALVFARKHWQLAKKPFLVYVTFSCLAMGLSIFSAYSETGIQPSKGSELFERAQNDDPLKALVLAKESTEPSEAFENVLARMPQAPENADEQKLMRLISEYRHYKKQGFTDRSRRYIMRNVTELLSLPGLSAMQGTELARIKKKLQEQQQKGLEAGAAPPKHNPLQAERHEKQPLQASNPSHFPPSLLKEIPEGLSKRPQARLNPASVNNLSSPGINQKKQESRDWKEDRWKKDGWKEDSAEAYSRTQKISFHQAKHYVGSQITFLNLSGIEQKCFLIGASAEALECEKRFQSGTFSTRYTRSEVRALRVVKH